MEGGHLAGKGALCGIVEFGNVKLESGGANKKEKSTGRMEIHSVVGAGTFP